MTGTWLTFALYFMVFTLRSLSEVDGSKYIPPIVLIPGCGGSQLEAKFDPPERDGRSCSNKIGEWFTIWLNLEIIIPFFVDCFIDSMKLEYDNVTRTTRNTRGVQTRIPGFGNTSTVEWLNPGHVYTMSYFSGIVNALLPLGYERGVSLKGAPYDFRKAPNELGDYFSDLQQLIETTHEETEQRVVLLAHSMGAPMMHYFLARRPQHWKDKYIETLVSLSGAWGGSVKAVNIYATGDSLGIPFLSAKTARVEQVTLPSLAFLLPSAELWGPDEVLLQTPDKNYTTLHFKEMFKDMDLPDAYDMYLDTKPLLYNASAPGTEVHCIHGEGIKTVEKLVYDYNSFPNYPYIINGDGDGTVNTRSTRFCLTWAKKQKQKIYHMPVTGLTHMGVLNDNVSISYLVDLLSSITRKNEQQAAKKIKNLIKSEKRKEKKIVMKYPGLEEAIKTQAASGAVLDETHTDNSSLVFRKREY